MRYIGSKTRVIPFISEIVNATVGDIAGLTMADLFAGTACVGEFFKRQGARIISNDYMQFSYALQIAKIFTNSIPECEIDYRKAISLLNEIEGESGFFYNEYTLEGTQEAVYQRNYFSSENAKKIDAIRRTVFLWRQKNMIDDVTYQLINASLVEAITKVSNTSGTYGAFLKIDDARKYKHLELKPFELYDNHMRNESFCKNIFDVIDKVEGDVLYLDPPYNSRQYPPYYHILETAVSNENPVIYGKTGRRPYQDKLSPFCVKGQALEALSSVVKKARFERIYISYSTEGIVNYDDMYNEMKQYGYTDIYFKSYRRYKSNDGGAETEKKLKELIVYVKKEKC